MPVEINLTIIGVVCLLVSIMFVYQLGMLLFEILLSVDETRGWISAQKLIPLSEVPATQLLIKELRFFTAIGLVPPAVAAIGFFFVFWVTLS